MRSIMLYVIFIFVAVTIVITTSFLYTVTINPTLESVYSENISPWFLLDDNSSFYSIYSFQGETNLIVRKIGHFALYGSLAVFFFWITPVKQLLLRGLTASLTASYIGLFDEIHQYFLMNRSGRLLDVYINTFGSITFVIVTIALYSSICKENSPNGLPIRAKTEA